MAHLTKCPHCSFENIQGQDRCSNCLHSLMERVLPKRIKDDKIQKVLMSDPVSELVTGKDLLVASPSDTVKKIVAVLQSEQKDCILVYRRKKLVGILGHRDLLHRVAGKHKDLSKVLVEDVMTPNPEFVTADAPIAYVVNKMAMGGYRSVPVLQEDGAPLSIVFIKDVIKYLAQPKK